ncbi:MAG: disulfide bond formation protein B [Chloroflexota bacterium]
MTVAAVEMFFGILALLAIAAMVVIWGLRLLGRASPAAADAYAGIAAGIAPNALAMAWIVAFLATTGSLYFSEVAGFQPCTLCWYQRIAMYPLVVVLAVAAARRERAGAIYAAALALVGAVVAAYHVTLEWFPSLDGGACDPAAPCTLIWFRVLGFISLPTLALVAFLFILTLLSVRAPREDDPDGRPRRIP